MFPYFVRVTMVLVFSVHVAEGWMVDHIPDDS